MMSFVDIFGLGDHDKEPGEQEEPERFPWWGPPEDELATAVLQRVVIGRSDQAVVALSHALVYSTGINLELIATARGLKRSEAQRLMHEMHAWSGDDDDLSDGFLRLGVEYPDGSRASNIRGFGMRSAYGSSEEPDEPIFIPQGGSGGSGHANRVVLRPGYWLWPLPHGGPLRLSCEWPAVGIGLLTVEIDTKPLAAAAAAGVPRLWETG